MRHRLSFATDAPAFWPAAATSRWLRFVKRSIDVLAATAVCLLLAPLLIATILAIKLGSPGPILHRRRLELKAQRRPM